MIQLIAHILQIQAVARSSISFTVQARQIDIQVREETFKFINPLILDAYYIIYPCKSIALA